MASKPKKEDYLPPGGLKLMFSMGLAYVVALLLCLFYAYFLMHLPADLTEQEASRFAWGIGVLLGTKVGVVFAVARFLWFIVQSYFGYHRFKADFTMYMLEDLKKVEQ